MSQATLGDIERAVRRLTRDTTLREQVNDSDRILDAINEAVQYVMANCPATPTLVSSFLTLVANDFDYAITAPADDQAFDSYNGFRLLSTGVPIERVDLPTLLNFRRGNPVDTGDPRLIAFTESDDRTMTAYLWPTPWQPDTVEALRVINTSVELLRYWKQGAANFDTALLLPGYIQAAIERRAAGCVLAPLGAELITKLGLGPSASASFLQSAEQFVDLETQRILKLRRAGTPTLRLPY